MGKKKKVRLYYDGTLISKKAIHSKAFGHMKQEEKKKMEKKISASILMPYQPSNDSGLAASRLGAKVNQKKKKR